MNRNFIWILLVVLTCVSAQGQDLIYSQYHLSPSLINPAFTGNTYGAYVSTQVRSQWLAHDFPYNSLSVSYSQQYNKASGIGLNITRDELSDGGLAHTSISGLYSMKVEIDRDTYLKAGAELSYVWSRLDWERFTFYDNLDPRYGAVLPGGETLPTEENFSGNGQNSYLDISTGIVFYTPKYYAGLSIKHINQPSNGFIAGDSQNGAQLPVLFSVQGGAQLAMADYGINTLYLTPNLLIATQSGSWQAIVGAYLEYDIMNGGLWYRQTAYNSDAIIASVGMEYGIFKISYSFDYTVSGLTIGSGGAHEIGLALNFEKIRPKESRYSDCFEIFR